MVRIESKNRECKQDILHDDTSLSNRRSCIGRILHKCRVGVEGISIFLQNKERDDLLDRSISNELLKVSNKLIKS